VTPEPSRLDDVRAYYDGRAPRLRAVELRNWHLLSRMSMVLGTIARHGGDPSAGRFLDIGCGTGFLVEQLGARGWQGVGVDLSPRSVEIANERLEAAGLAGRIHAEVGSAYEPPEGPFALITLTDVLEHLEDPRACVAALRERLAPGGLLVISTPNRHSLPGARRWLAEHGMGFLKLNLAPVDRWQTWGDLEAHAASAGLLPVSRRGIHFLPGGQLGTSLGRIHRLPAARRAEIRLSRSRAARAGFYICCGFRAPGAA
jgi:2-polyprenyl-6-hydroxyphenyl methylase / 3-demethylubiquinone-9 3-methyltransferase